AVVAEDPLDRLGREDPARQVLRADLPDAGVRLVHLVGAVLVPDDEQLVTAPAVRVVRVDDRHGDRYRPAGVHDLRHLRERLRAGVGERRARDVRRAGAEAARLVGGVVTEVPLHALLALVDEVPGLDL